MGIRLRRSVIRHIIELVGITLSGKAS